MADRDYTKFRLKNTIKYPTSLLINGSTGLGLEIAESLLEQGGYVIIIDAYTEANLQKIDQKLGQNTLITLLDYSAIPHLEEDLRRLDYVFYLSHEGMGARDDSEISTQDFLKYSNNLDTILALTVKYEAKLLLSTSIKAHQQLVASMDLDVNFGRDATQRHSVYTDMEVQRYAESLCLEYVNKAGLNARIVRIAEIIGEGLDLSRDTSFIRLMLAAASGRELELYNDGLDSQWYVHTLDAAYGLIKAQFSKNTEGEIYSLAYETTVTDLSIAYKLQELEPEAKEISFHEHANNLPPLRLYKPAPNLSHIGWKPRVELEQSIKESLAVAKLSVLQSRATQQRYQAAAESAKPSVVDKIKSFLSIANQEETSIEELAASGPVSRLIAERKLQEQLREASLDKADTILRSKRKIERKITWWHRVEYWFWRNILDTSTNFPFLRRLTLSMFLTYLVLFILAGFIYFTVLSPLAVVGRNIYVTMTAIDNLQLQVANRDMAEILAESRVIKDSLTETATTMERYTSLLNVVALGEYWQDSTQLLRSYALAAEGIENVSYALEPFAEYQKRYVDNLRFRPDSDSYLSASTGTDYSPILDEMAARKAFAQIGLQKLDQAVLEINSYNYSNLPEGVGEYLRNINSKLQSLDELEGFANVAIYANDLFGLQTARTYLIMLLDNSRPMPIGGELSAFMLLTVQNGSIIDVKLQSIDELDADLISLPEYALTEINLRSSTVLSAADLRVNDLAKIGDVELFADVAKEVWSAAFSKDIDALVLLDYSYLQDLLPLWPEMEIDGQRIDAESLLDQLESLQPTNQTAERRNDIMAQLSAKLMDTLMDSTATYLPRLVTTGHAAVVDKHIIIPRSELSFDELVEAEKFYGDLIDNTDFPVSIHLTSDRQIISPDSYPTLNFINKVGILPDLTLVYDMVVKFPGVENLQNVTVCLPAGTRDVTVGGVADDKVKIVNANNKQCVITTVTNQTELQFGWESLPIASPDFSEYNLSLGQSKIMGSQVIADYEISVTSGLSLIQVNPSITPDEGMVDFTETMTTDRVIDIRLQK